MEKKTEFKKYNKAIALKIIRILEKRYMKGYFFENSQDAVKDAYQLLFDSWNKNTIEHVEEFKLLLMNRSVDGNWIIRQMHFSFPEK